MRVLVIEDDSELRASVVDALADSGHEPIAAADGLEALRALEKGPRPDVIVLDLTMPRMDGQTFRVHQLADARFAEIPTVVITARTKVEARKAAVGPILYKPFTIGALLATIQLVVEPPSPRKSCACCGRTYDADEWRSLTFLGELDNGRAIGERLELRLCVCGTSLAWELGAHAISVPPPPPDE